MTCCLERSRYDIVKHVIKNIVEACPRSWRETLTVFDNSSTYLGLGELRDAFPNVVRADMNVGYWTAIDWWLRSMRDDPPRYTYIIESDMIHNSQSWLMDGCVAFLDEHAELGAMRLHEYKVAERHLYDKDRPVDASRKSLWQSHTNRVTGEPVRHNHVDGAFWHTNFLTQLPALNRYDTMVKSFDGLAARESFSEPDFQALYHEQYEEIALLDGGMFSCDLNPYGTSTITGSWTDPAVLQRLGYKSTRHSSILAPHQYNVCSVP